MMIFSPYWHLPFDLLGFLVSGLLFRRELKRLWPIPEIQNTNAYWASLAIGAVIGAYFLGSLNLSLMGYFRLGHSVAGALVGSIAAVEVLKLTRSYRVSTGALFVLPISAGIAVGRIGCFLSGLSDETFGQPTNVLLGVDFGDGLFRHPVQLYEAVALLAECFMLAQWSRRNPANYRDYSFYGFVIFYAVQRFFWEFLKPYPKLLGPLNLFHFVCMVLTIYGILMIRASYANSSRASTTN